MTALILDGFAHYGTGTVSRTNLLAGAYGELTDGTSILQYPPWAQPADQFPVLYQASDIGISQAQANRKILPTTKNTLYWSLRYGLDSLPSINGWLRICDFRDTSNTVIGSLGVQSTGAIALFSDVGGHIVGGPPTPTTLVVTSGPVIVPENMHFLEMYYDKDTGTFTLRVDDPTGVNTPVLTGTGLSFGGSTGIAAIGLLNNVQWFNNNPVYSYLTDLFIRDDQGTHNNDWLGDRRVATLFVDADTTTAGWQPRYYKQLGAGILNNTSGNACVSSPTATSLDIGANDFTLETFVRFQSLPTSTNKSVIFSRWDETNNRRSYQFFLGSVGLNSGSLCFQTSTDGTSSTVAQPIVYPWTPELDTWYHMAIVRAAGELLLFVDGVQLGLPIADSRTYYAGTAPFSIGAMVEGTTSVISNTNVLGWFDETRFTNGFARYTTNFTPTTVEFPRGSGGDPEWSMVALLAGFNSVIQDESSFLRSMTSRNGAFIQVVNDGPLIGVWSTMGKATPDDNTFSEAPYLAASSILTLSAQPAADDTVTVGTSDGSTPAVYTFKSSVSAAFQVLIDTTLQQTLQNLYNAINAGAGAGTKYGTGTTANVDVVASQLPAGQMRVDATTLGTGGNSIATSVSLTNGGSWTGSTLSGGVNIPGPSNFKVQRPPPLTTIISAVQATYRAYKSDAGICSINSAFVGPLGGVDSDSAHNLTVSPIYYGDIYEEDPDTSASITPATIVNGAIQLNRAT